MTPAAFKTITPAAPLAKLMRKPKKSCEKTIAGRIVPDPDEMTEWSVGNATLYMAAVIHYHVFKHFVSTTSAKDVAHHFRIKITTFRKCLNGREHKWGSAIAK